MKKWTPFILISLVMTGIVTVSFIDDDNYTVAQLRELYSGSSERWPKPNIDQQINKTFQDIGKLGKPEFPASNPYTKEKEILGKMLFFDPRLSASKQIACASCHDPELQWGDGRHLSFGHDRQNGKRNAMTIVNTAYYQHLFWDGRAASLEEQSQFPVQDKLEMAQSLDSMVSNVRAVTGYQPYFTAAFGNPTVSKETIQKALATFERIILSRNSRFDSFVSGNNKALSDDEVKGLHLFRTKARCINCHNTPLFSDNQFHNDGQALYGSKLEDLGRYNITHNKEDIGKFRTPSLREVARTGPWMHHGNFPTLRDVIEYYNLGNPAPIQRFVKVDESMRPVTSPLLQKLYLTDNERNQLEAFLNAISTPVQKISQPVLPR